MHTAWKRRLPGPPGPPVGLALRPGGVAGTGGTRAPAMLRGAAVVWLALAAGCAGRPPARGNAPEAAPDQAEAAATPQAAARNAGRAPGATPAPAAGGDLARLEEELFSLIDPPAPAGVPADPDAVPAGFEDDIAEWIRIVDRRDGPDLYRALEPRFLEGGDSFRTLYAFLRRTDIEREKILALTHHPQLYFALLRLVAYYPDQTARFARYALRASRAHPDSFIRRELFNFLPVFLNHHRGRYLWLRELLKRDVVYQIEHGGHYLYKVFLAQRDLGFEAPARSYLAVLLDPAQRSFHGAVIRRLGERGPEGWNVLAEFLEKVKNPAENSVIAALRELSRRSASAPLLERFLADARAAVRRAAVLAYFERERPESALPRALDFLRGPAAPRDKRALVRLIARRSPALFARLEGERAGLPEDVAAFIAKESERLAERADDRADQDGAPAEEETPESRAPPVEPGERLRELETALAQAREDLAVEKTEPDPRARLPENPEPVPTLEFAKAAASARRGVAPEALKRRVVELIERRDGPGLFAELRPLLLEGPEGWEILVDLLRALEETPRLAGLLPGQYQIAFGLMHLAMLHEVEFARFAHYYLGATWETPRTFFRERFYYVVPIFLRFHRGRFIELVRAVRQDIEDKLVRGNADIVLLFDALDTLGIYPELEIVAPILAKATSLQEKTAVLEHLAKRDDPPAARVVIRFIRWRQDYGAEDVILAMTALARMQNLEAQKAMEYFLSGRERDTVPAATIAYFSVPRTVGSLEVALRLLRSDAEFKWKRRLVHLLYRSQREVFAALRDRADSFTDAEVRTLLKGFVKEGG